MKSLRQALLARILTGLLLVLVLAGLAVFLVARSSFRAQLDEALAARARTFASLVIEEPPDEEDAGALVFDYKGSLREADVGVLVRITTDKGEVLGESPDWPLQGDRLTSNLSPGGAPAFRDIDADDGAKARMASIATFAVKEPDESASASQPTASHHVVVVQVIGGTDAVKRAESAVLVALFFGGICAAAGTAVAVWLGIRRGLVPIRRLSSTLDQIGAQELALPSSHERYPEELEPIIAAVQGLLARLRAAMERERRFTDAAAHELRTPIAELRTITDVADRWPDPDRLRRSVIEARAIADEMEALLESLLAVARGGKAYESQPTESVLVLPLARTIAEPKLEQLRRRGVSFALEGEDDARWHGPRGAILAILRNLIENAAEYTPDGGSVRISATTNNGSTNFEIENGPVSLQPDQAVHIFEPFWRADTARSDRKHRGLGLSIVATLADALQLRRDVAVTPERRLRISLSS